MPFQDFAREAAPGVGSLLGGLAGAAFGVPTVGASLGGAAGGLVSNLIPKTETPFQKEAREAQMSLLQSLKQQSPFQKVDFDPIRQQEISRFNQETIPNLAQRFASSPGKFGSGIFQKALGEAGSDLSSRLAALQAQHEVGQQGAQLRSQGLDLSRLGQLQSFLGEDRLGAAQQLAAQRGQTAGLLGLGQQAGQQQVQNQDTLRKELEGLYDRAGQYGSTEPGQAPPSFSQNLIKFILQAGLKAGGAAAGVPLL